MTSRVSSTVSPIKAVFCGLSNDRMSEQVRSREPIEDPFYFTTGETETRNGKSFTCGPFMTVCQDSDSCIILFLAGQEAPGTPLPQGRGHNFGWICTLTQGTNKRRLERPNSTQLKFVLLFSGLVTIRAISQVGIAREYSRSLFLLILSFVLALENTASDGHKQYIFKWERTTPFIHSGHHAFIHRYSFLTLFYAKLPM